MFHLYVSQVVNAVVQAFMTYQLPALSIDIALSHDNHAVVLLAGENTGFPTTVLGIVTVAIVALVHDGAVPITTVTL